MPVDVGRVALGVLLYFCAVQREVMVMQTRLMESSTVEDLERRGQSALSLKEISR